MFTAPNSGNQTGTAGRPKTPLSTAETPYRVLPPGPSLGPYDNRVRAGEMQAGQVQQPTTPAPTPNQPTPTPTSPPFAQGPNYTGPLPKLGDDPSDAYQDIYLPGAARALDLLKDRRGFTPINMPALPGIKGPLKEANQTTAGMARQGVANQQALQGANALGGVVAQNGMATGTAAPLQTMDNIASGQRAVMTGQRFANMANDPLTAQQMQAQGLYENYQAGGGNVLTRNFNPALYGQTNQFQDAAAGVSGNISGGNADVSTQGFQQLAGQVGGPSYSEQNLQSMATMTPGSNPYLDELERLTNDQITAEIARSMSGAGRYGSGVMSGQMADAISRNVLQGRLSQYNIDANRQMAANQQMDQQRLAGANLQRGLAGDIANVQAGNVGRQQSAANALQALGNTVAANQLGAAGQVANVDALNRGRQMAAAEALGATGQQARQNEMAATDALTRVQGTNIANQANTAQAAIGARQLGLQDMMRATALQPEVLATRYADADRLRQVGNTIQTRADTNFADLRDRRYQTQQAPFSQLEAYMALTGMTPPAGLSYEAQQNATQAAANAARPSGLQQAIGTAGMIGGALNRTGLLQPIANGAGSVIDTVVGTIFG